MNIIVLYYNMVTPIILLTLDYKIKVNNNNNLPNKKNNNNKLLLKPKKLLKLSNKLKY